MSDDVALPLQFTEAAANKVKSLIADEDNPNLKLRVYITGGGCSGFQYGFIFATAFAIKVFPVPGAPYSKIPFGVSTFTYSIASLCFSGHSIASRNSSFSESNPPTSSQVTFGT